MIDMHTHILPMVDDGAKTFEEALEMLKMEFEQGFRRIVLTPHVQNRVQKVSSKELNSRFEKFQAYVGEHLPDMKLYLGAEVKYDALKTDAPYERYVFQGTKYLLMEFSVKSPEPIVDCLYDLVAKGFKPILAHVERYDYLTIEEVKRIRQDGSLIQVNAGAILGSDGFSIKRRAMKYINEELVDLIASDTHNTKSRKPNALPALEKVAKKYNSNKLKEFRYE